MELLALNTRKNRSFSLMNFNRSRFSENCKNLLIDLFIFAMCINILLTFTTVVQIYKRAGTTYTLVINYSSLILKTRLF